MTNVLFENELALVLIVKNESRYIEEWLEYHYRIGVDKFYIYNNDSDDRSELLEILDPWISAGIVDFEDALGEFKQMPVYNDALERHRFDCRYMGFIDTDEFIFIKTGQTLPEFLNELFSHDVYIAGVGINWRMFGTSGHQKYAPIDVIERFTYRAPDDYDANVHIKTILNPRRALSFSNPHYATYFATSVCCDEHGNHINGFSSDNNTTDSICINHYYMKSVSEYLEKKARGRADFFAPRDDDIVDSVDLNNVEDVGLRDLWRQLKLKPLDLTSRQKDTVANIKEILLSNSELNIEAMVTYFSVIQRTDQLNAKHKSKILKFLFQSLSKSLVDHNPTSWDFMLILLEYPEILKSKSVSGIKLLRLCWRLIPQLIAICESEARPECRFAILQIQKALEVFLR